MRRSGDSKNRVAASAGSSAPAAAQGVRGRRRRDRGRVPRGSTGHAHAECGVFGASVRETGQV